MSATESWIALAVKKGLKDVARTFDEDSDEYVDEVLVAQRDGDVTV